MKLINNPIIRIKNKSRELYESRHIVRSLVKKNLCGKYKNSILGFGWQFLTPLITILLFYILYTGIMDRDVENYWVYLCSGMFAFYFMFSCINAGSMCIVSNGSLINKMYFPREILVISHVISAFIIMIISYAIVFILMFISGIPINIYSVLYLIPTTAIMIVFGIGIVFLLSSIVVYVRDVHFIIEAFSRVMFWTTPVFYLLSDSRDILSIIATFNPLTYFIECFHDALYYSTMLELNSFITILIVSIISITVGYATFTVLRKGFSERL